MSPNVSAIPHIALPELSDELIRSTSGTGVVWNESRRYRRKSCTSHCKLQSEPTFASAGHEPVSQDVLLRDISRGGVRFIHGAQLFPGERCELIIEYGKQLNLEIVWCRCVDVGLFVSGCNFVASKGSSR